MKEMSVVREVSVEREKKEIDYLCEVFG